MVITKVSGYNNANNNGYGSNYGTNNHLRCAGHASNCSSYHMEKPDKSSSTTFHKHMVVEVKGF